MRLDIDQDLCISCGTCVDMCPEVFFWNDDEKAQAIEGDISSENEDQANEAMESCPTNAIAVK